MIDSINYFCNYIANKGLLRENRYIHTGYWAHWAASDALGVYIKNSVQVKPGCEWQFDMGECQRYMRVTVDSCDCGGTNYKKGDAVENKCLNWRMDPTGYVLPSDIGSW
jgi:hypothetical protein